MKNPTTRPPLGPNATRVKEYTERGLSARDISILLQISTQRVYQILKALEERGELSTEAAS